LYCAENPTRDIFVGGAGRVLSLVGEYAPTLTDKVMENRFIDAQMSDRPYGNGKHDSLYHSSDSGLQERGNYDGHVAERSLYTAAALHPTITSAVATGTALALGAGLAYTILKKNNAH
jgi:hypothetical protein